MAGSNDNGMTGSFHLILLPGTGADHRLFEPQRQAFPQLVVPRWLSAKQDESLPDYAARLAGTIVPQRPMVLGGVSFGGMVACEMARHLRPEALVLIASCRDQRGIRPALRLLRPVAVRVPATAGTVLKWLAPPVVAAFRRLTPQQRQLCLAMFRDTDAGFMKWAVTAILSWQAQPLPAAPVFQIHGLRDPVIPAQCVTADEVIPDGGHLINLTHAGQVNAFIRKALEALP